MNAAPSSAPCGIYWSPRPLSITVVDPPTGCNGAYIAKTYPLSIDQAVSIGYGLITAALGLPDKTKENANGQQ